MSGALRTRSPASDTAKSSRYGKQLSWPTFSRLTVPSSVATLLTLRRGYQHDSHGAKIRPRVQVEAIPRCRPLPEKMSAEERAWLARMVARRGGVRLPPQPPEPHDFEYMPLEDRQAINNIPCIPVAPTSAGCRCRDSAVVGSHP